MNRQAFYRDMPVKRKLLSITGLSVAAAMLFAMAMEITAHWFIERAEMKENLVSHARILAENSATPLLFGDWHEAENILGALGNIGSIESAVVLDRSGKPFASYLRQGSSPPRSHRGFNKEEFSFGATRAEVGLPIVAGNERIGSIHLLSNLKPMYEKMAWNIAALLAAMLGGLFIAAALIARLHTIITRPIATLAALMEQVSREKNYALRSDFHGNDELGTLGREFNAMLAQIQARDQALAQHRAQLEKEVAQRTANLTEAQRIAHLGNWEWDIVGNSLSWSDEIYRIFGLAPQEFGATREAFLQAVHPEDRQFVEAHIRDALELMRPYSIDHRVLKTDGSLRYVHEQGEVFRGQDGKPIMMRGTVQDITERKLAAQSIEESERKFRAILDAAVDGILVADGKTNRFILGNRAICDMLGYRPDEITRLSVDDIHPHEALAEVKRQFERQLGGEIRVAVNLPVKRKDGSVFFADISSSPMELANNPFLVGVFHDVTERKQVEEKIQKLNEELELKVRQRTQQLLEAQEELVRKEKLAVLGQVAGSVGHELRNPLGVMSNAVYFLQTVLCDASESVREYLDIIKSEIMGSERIVSDLLDSVRTKPPQPETVVVAQLIEQTLRKCAVPSSVTVRLDIPDFLPPVVVDPLQIHQVFRNLISNAIDAMPDGGTLEIRVAENRGEKTVTVSVRDTGTGMTPEQFGKLFQPLFTTKARGIGLGLVVVKNLTEANGGKVEVQSAAGKGTLFSVTLPIELPAAGAKRKEKK